MSHALLARLNESRKTIAAQSQAILDGADAEGRALTADEDKRFSDSTDELIAIRDQMTQVRAHMDQQAQIAEAMERGIGAGAGNQEHGKLDDEAKLRGIIKGEHRGDSAFLPSGGAFRKAIESRALAKSANSVKVTFVEQLWQHLVDTSSVLSTSTVWETSSGETMDVPITTNHGAASTAPTAEAAAITGTDPTLSKRSLGAYKYAQIITLSRELVDDASFDILGYVAEVIGRNTGLALGAHLVTGTGSSQPTGVVTSASAGVTGSTGVVGAFSADNLIDLFYSVIAPYRRSPKAAWLLRDSSLATVRKLKDGAGRYLFDNWNTPTMSPADGTILGKPVYTDPNVAAVALNAKSVLFGDFSKFVVRLAGGVRFERSDDYAFGNDQVTFRGIIRGDSLLIDQTGAVKYFAGGAS